MPTTFGGTPNRFAMDNAIAQSSLPSLEFWRTASAISSPGSGPFLLRHSGLDCLSDIRSHPPFGLRKDVQAAPHFERDAASLRSTHAKRFTPFQIGRHAGFPGIMPARTLGRTTTRPRPQPVEPGMFRRQSPRLRSPCLFARGIPVPTHPFDCAPRKLKASPLVALAVGNSPLPLP